MLNKIKTCLGSIVTLFIITGHSLLAQTAVPATDLPIPEMTIPACAAAPKIDGVLDDECWQKATVVTNFNIVGEKGMLTGRHKALVTRDGEWLYVAFDVAQPASDRNPPIYRKHDETVQRENNVQVSFDPGTGGNLYYQFLINPANVRADFRMTREKGRERENWNIPWRSATKAGEAGWQAEIALPWCLLLTHGDLAKAKFNLIVVTFTPVRDKCAVQMGVKREKTSWAPLMTNFHEPERFGLLKGLEDMAAKAPFLPFLTGARVGAYRVEGDKYFYDVTLGVQDLSGRPGAMEIVVEDKPEGAPSQATRKDLDITGNSTQDVAVAVPVKSLVKRVAEVSLADKNSGEVWQKIIVDDTAVLDLFGCYLDRNYYTTEEKARAICRIGLPADGLKGMLLRSKDKDGKVLAETKELQPATVFEMPLKDLAAGAHKLAIELCQADGSVATRQEIMLVKRAPKPGSEVKVDRVNCVLLKDGKPFFPYGFIMADISSRNEWAFKDVGESGFTGIFQWGRCPADADYKTDARAYMDMAGKYNLNVVLAPDLAYAQAEEVTDPDGILTSNQLAAVNKDIKMYRGSLTAWKGMLVSNPHLRYLSVEHKGRLYYQLYEKEVARLLETIKNASSAPNMIGTYMLDEPLVLEINQDIAGRDYYHKVHETDGYHPVFVLYSSEIPETPRAVDWCDALGTDPYWIPAGDHRSTVNWVSKIVANTKRRADEVHSVTFTVPMSAYWSACRKRTIFPEEQRCQTYLALIHGSKAIFYFIYPVITQAVYDELKNLAGEMKTLGPICLMPDVEQNVSYSPGVLDPIHDKFTDVQVCLRQNPGGGYVLLAANTAYYPVDTTFTVSLLGDKGKVKRLFSKATCPVKNRAFSEQLKGFETRAYVIESQATENQQSKIEIQVAMTPHPELAKAEPPASNEEKRAGKRNLLPNSSFEQTSVPGWPDFYRYTGTPIMPHERIGAPTAVWGADTTKPYHGRYCLLMDGGTNKHRISYIEPRNLKSLTEQPRSFVLSVWMRANRDGVTAQLRVGLVLAQKYFTLTREWQRYSLPVTIPAKTDETVIWMHNPNGKNQDGDKIWLDAVQFEVGDQPTDYEP